MESQQAIRRLLFVLERGILNDFSTELITIWIAALQDMCQIDVMDCNLDQTPHNSSGGQSQDDLRLKSIQGLDFFPSYEYNLKLDEIFSNSRINRLVPPGKNISRHIRSISDNYEIIFMAAEPQAHASSKGIRHAYEILHKVRSSVFVIPTKDPNQSIPTKLQTPKYILFAVSKYTITDIKLSQIAFLARIFHARVIVLHVVHIKPTVMDPDLKYEAEISEGARLLSSVKKALSMIGVDSSFIHNKLLKTNDSIPQCIINILLDPYRLGIRPNGEFIYQFDVVVLGSNMSTHLPGPFGSARLGETVFRGSLSPLLLVSPHNA